MEIAVEVKDLRKKYLQAWSPALDGLSFEVHKGKIYGLLGPNGAGKTTAINILCGLIPQDSGLVKVFNRSIQDGRDNFLRQFGLVPQQFALFENLNAIQNFEYIGILYGYSKEAIHEKAHQLMTRLGLIQHAKKRVGKYSGGMKRRANLIAALLHDPELLILDEPTAGVDVQSRALILEFIQEYNALGKTVMYTSHHLEEAEKLCHHIAIIDEGKFIVQGSPETLVDQTANCQNLEDVFLAFTGRRLRD